MKKKLLDCAIETRKKAEAKYSNFKVGASVLCKSGTIYTGCNIESSSYGLTICAERVAIFKALSEEKSEIVEIHVVANTKEAVSPCGACRQIILDYAQNAVIVLHNLEGAVKQFSATDLLPYHFKDKDLTYDK
jgi:cytidine deaminase